MKIATWNIQRPEKDTTRLVNIQKKLASLDADILILTETNKFIELGSKYQFYHSANLTDPMYKEGEARTSIYSKYRTTASIPTFNNETSICEVFNTPFGEIAIYATIIGIFGNRNPNFKTDLNFQLKDFEDIGKRYPLCIVGDYNISFSDNYYFTIEGRNKLFSAVDELNLVNLTEKLANNIDHIVVSKSFLTTTRNEIETWNLDKKLSDHIGVMVKL